MRDYSKVGPQIWIGKTGKLLRAAGPRAQIVSLYLMTSPHANMLGLYYVSLNSIAHETGLGMEGASEGLERCIEAGFCSYDEATEIVWVYEMASYQIAESLLPTDKRSAGVQNEYNALPGNPYLGPFFDKYAKPFNMKKRRQIDIDIVSPSEAPSIPHRSQEQEQEHEQEQETPPMSAGGVTAVTLSIAMRRNGVNSQPADPRLIELANQGVTPETVDAACEEGKKSKPGEVIGLGYVVAILQRWAKEAAAMKVEGAKVPKKGGAWWATDASIAAKGLEMTPPIKPLPGQSMQTLKGRIEAAIDNGGTEPPPQRGMITEFPLDEPQQLVKPDIASLRAMIRAKESTL